MNVFIALSVIDLTIMGSRLLRKEPSVAKMLPLVRLKVDYSGGFSLFNTARFGTHFADRVAVSLSFMCNN